MKLILSAYQQPNNLTDLFWQFTNLLACEDWVVVKLTMALTYFHIVLFRGQKVDLYALIIVCQTDNELLLKKMSFTIQRKFL